MSYLGRVDRSAVWGQISGTLSDQTDLQSALDAKVDPTQLEDYRNKIINGNFDIWQRGTSQTASGYGSADRWNSSISGTTQSVSRQSFGLGQTDVPNNPTFFYRNVVTSVAGASNFCVVQQPIENVRTASGQNVTVSFWAKADSNKQVAIELAQIFGTGGSPSASVFGIGAQKFSVTASWQKFTATIAVPSISGATLGTDGNNRLVFVIWFDAGSSFNSRSDSLGQQSGTFDIAQVQLEIGNESTPFQTRQYEEELLLCQRYAFVLRGPTNFPGFGLGYCTSGTVASIIIPHPVHMRGLPALTTSGSFATTTAGGGNVAVTSLNVLALTQTTYVTNIDITVASGLVAGDVTYLFGNNSATASLTLTAEL